MVLRLPNKDGKNRVFKIKKVFGDLLVRKDSNESISEDCNYIYGKKTSYYYWFPFPDEIGVNKKYYIPKSSPIYERSFKKAIFEINEMPKWLTSNSQKKSHTQLKTQNYETIQRRRPCGIRTRGARPRRHGNRNIAR